MKTLREYIDLLKEADGLTNPWPAGTPHATAWDTMSPEDKKWLGGADPTDQYILARAPNKGKPVATPAPTPTPAPAAVATPVAEPTKIEPTPLAPSPTPATPAKPAGGQGAKPAGPNPVLTLQQKLIALGADIKADGIMGPKTQAAMKQYGLNADGTSIAKNISAPGQPPATLMKDTPAGQLQTDAARAAKRASDKDPTGTSLNSRVTVAQPTGAIAPTAINRGSGVGKNATLDTAQASAATDALNDPNVSAADKAFLKRMLANTNATTAPTATSNVAKPAPTANARSAPAVSANSTTLPDGTPIERSQGNSSSEYMNQFGGSAPNQGGAAPVQQQAAPVQQQAAPPPKVSPRPANMRSREAAEWNKQFGATHDPRTGAVLGESVRYNELDRIINLVHYR